MTPILQTVKLGSFLYELNDSYITDCQTWFLYDELNDSYITDCQTWFLYDELNDSYITDCQTWFLYDELNDSYITDCQTWFLLIITLLNYTTVFTLACPKMAVVKGTIF